MIPDHRASLFSKPRQIQPTAIFKSRGHQARKRRTESTPILCVGAANNKCSFISSRTLDVTRIAAWIGEVSVSLPQLMTRVEIGQNRIGSTAIMESDKADFHNSPRGTSLLMTAGTPQSRPHTLNALSIVLVGSPRRLSPEWMQVANLSGSSITSRSNLTSRQ